MPHAHAQSIASQEVARRIFANAFLPPVSCLISLKLIDAKVVHCTAQTMLYDRLAQRAQFTSIQFDSNVYFF